MGKMFTPNPPPTPGFASPFNQEIHNQISNNTEYHPLSHMFIPTDYINTNIPGGYDPNKSIYKQLSTGGNDPSITKNMRYSNYVNYSRAYNILNANLYLVPNTPTITFVKGEDSAISIGWDVIPNGGLPIRSFTIYYYDGNTTQAIIIDTPNVTSYTIPNVTNGTVYFIAITANNANGDSPTSIPVYTIPYGVPIHSTITYIAAGYQKIDLSWNAYPNGSPIQYYILDVSYQDYLGEPITFYTDISTNQLGYELSGLIAGYTYFVSVKAVNDAGSSISSATESAIPYLVPDKPTITAMIPGNHSIVANWVPPIITGSSAILSYEIDVSYGGSVIQTIMVSAHTLSLDISTNLVNGNSYSIYVSAYNNAGQSSADVSSAVPRTVPFAPSITSIVSGNREIAVGWSMPSNNGGSAITGYKIDVSYGGAFINPSIYTDDGTFSTVINTNLTNGNMYFVYVSAINAAGVSPVDISSTIPYYVPFAPSITSILSSNQEFVVNWNAPRFDGGSVITGYEIDVSFGGAFIQTIMVKPNTFSLDISTNLTNGNSYDVYVSAINRAGTSFADISSAIPYSIPLNPAITSIVPRDQIIDLSFTAYPNGSPIQYYTLDVSYQVNIGSPIIHYMDIRAYYPFYEISGLTNGYTYFISASARNAAGASLVDVSSTVPYGVPLNPMITAAVPGNTIIDLSFTAYPNGSPIQSYKLSVFYINTNGSIVKYADINTPDTFYEIGDLSNGYTYYIYVAARNAAGFSLSSNPVSTVPYTVPDMPTITSVIPADQQINMYWNAPEFNGGSLITGYEVDVYLEGSIIQTIQTNANTYFVDISTNLINGNTYSISVVAMNASGNSMIDLSSTIPYGVPLNTEFTSIVPDDQLIHLSFMADSNGSTIQYYTLDISYNDGIHGWNHFMDVSTDYPFYELDGLTNGYTYSISVVATNAAGTSSADVSSAFPYTYADKPTITAISQISCHIDISWNAPAFNGGSSLTGYKIDVSSNGSIVQTIQTDATSTYLDISGLTDGNNYYVYVYPINAANQSPPYLSPNYDTSFIRIPGYNWVTQPQPQQSPITKIAISGDATRISILYNSSTNCLYHGVLTNGSYIWTIDACANIIGIGPSAANKSVSLSNDGSRIVVSNNNSSNRYIYTGLLINGTYKWNQEQSAVFSTTNWYDVAISKDGTRIVTCAIGGNIYTAELINSSYTWFKHTTASSNSILPSTSNWRSVAISGDGNRLAVNTTSSPSSVYTAYLSNNSYIWKKEPSTVIGTTTLYSVALDYYGNNISTCVNSTPGYVFIGTLSTDGSYNWIQQNNLSNSYPNTARGQWRSLAFSNDGTRIIASAGTDYRVYTGILYNSSYIWSVSVARYGNSSVCMSSDGNTIGSIGIDISNAIYTANYY